MNNSEINYEKIARYLVGECTVEEASEIESRMATDKEFKVFVNEFQRIWNAKKASRKVWNVESTWKQVNEKIDSESHHTGNNSNLQSLSFRQVSDSKHNGLHWFVRIAAVLMIVGVTALFAVMFFEGVSEEKQIVMQEVITEKGQRSNLHLGDGSHIRLNSDSKISYPSDFGAKSRNIHLSGEAYFDIVFDDGRPFFVHAEEAVIEVIGTEFNVQAYSEEDLRVVVAEGKVSVRIGGAGDEDGSFLEKGDKASLLRDNLEQGFIITHNVNLDDHLGWMKYRFSFDDVPMEKVAVKLERIYGVDINFSDPELSRMSISATFEGESIQEVLRVIELALDLNYEMNGHEVYLSRSDAPEDDVNSDRQIQGSEDI